MIGVINYVLFTACLIYVSVYWNGCDKIQGLWYVVVPQKELWLMVW